MPRNHQPQTNPWFPWSQHQTVQAPQQQTPDLSAQTHKLRAHASRLTAEEHFDAASIILKQLHHYKHITQPV